MTSKKYTVKSRHSYRCKFKSFLHKSFIHFWPQIIAVLISLYAGWTLKLFIESLRDEALLDQVKSFLTTTLNFCIEHDFQISTALSFCLALTLAGLIKGRTQYKKSKLLDSSGVFYAQYNHNKKSLDKSDTFLNELALTSSAIKIMGSTGLETFSRGKTVLHEPANDCRDLHVLLANPFSQYTKKRAADLGIQWQAYVWEICETIKFLKDLKEKDDEKTIILKMYWNQPFWKLIILDRFAWVQQYRKKNHVRDTPCFAIKAKNPPKYGLFTFMNRQFMKYWDSPKVYEYNFDNNTIRYWDQKILVQGNPFDIIKSYVPTPINHQKDCSKKTIFNRIRSMLTKKKPTKQAESHTS